jgi:polysaccharide export outer membrane protein
MEGYMVTSRKTYFLFFIFCFLQIFTFAGNNQAFAEQSDEVEQSAQPEKINTREAYRIDVGDVLEINVWKEVELTRGATVRLDGMISLPLIGDVLAAGYTPMELAKSLEEKIGEIIEEPTVTVILTASNSRVYYMVGNISGGEYALNTPINLLQAIARAGGLGEWADKDNIMIVRRSSGKDEMVFFDYKKFVKGKDLSQNIMVHYGDTIVVF